MLQNLVVVASLNPVKISAGRKGFNCVFPDLDSRVIGIDAPSHVSAQPKNSEETRRGAENRVMYAMEHEPQADYWVGIEGGIERTGDDVEVFAWVVIKSRYTTGNARTGTFYLPRKIIDLLDAGKELGDADDIVFGRKNSKQENGVVGILTKDIINRETYYTHAVVLSLIPFMNPQLYAPEIQKE
jgi:inosine/xanthosine triphosphatase